MADLDVGDYDVFERMSPPPALAFSPRPPAESTSPSAGGTSSSGAAETVGLSTITMVFAMVLYMSVGHHISHSSKYLGEGMAAALTGLMLGILLLLCSNIFISEETLQQLLSFDHSSFFTFYLPPIILFAGLSVRKKAFFKQLPTIASLGIIGTYIAFALIAVLMFATSKFISGITLADCLALGAIFATTDSVAVLQVLEQDRAPLLFSFVFGEGVINDATTVALLRTVQGLGITPAMTFETVLIIFGKFIYLFAISMIMGLAFGFGASLLLKKYSPSGVPQAVGMVGTTAYMSYLVSDHLGLSGIVTLFCCSVCMSHYALHSLTKTQRAATLSSFETLSYLAEGSIFVYVGLDALDPEKWADTNVGRASALSVIVILVLLFSRAVFCFPILAAHNYFSTERVNYREMFIAWWAGGMRGAVSVALVYFYYDSDAENGCGRDCATLISMTLIVVLFSTLVFGSITKPLLDFMLGAEVAPSESSAPGLEMVQDPMRYKGHKADMLRLHQDEGPVDSGYETDGTAFSDAGYTTEGDEGPQTPLSEAQGLLQDMEAGESMQPGLRLQAAQSAHSSPATRLPGSILKGLAPRALIASPEGSPRAGDEPEDWNTLAEVQGLAPSALEEGDGQDAEDVGPKSAAATPRERPRVKFSEINERREYRPTSPLNSTSSIRRASSAENLASSARQPAGPPPPLRMPLRLGGGRPQTIQLAEWWADFDEKFMRPVFSRGDNVSTPPGHGHSQQQPHGTPREDAAHHTHRRGVSAMSSAASQPLPQRLSRPRSESDFGANAVWNQPESSLPASSPFQPAGSRPAGHWPGR